MTTDCARRLKLFVFKLICVVTVMLVGLVALEATARILGLGDPILYYTDPWGGLRPAPNQRVSRFRGATVTIDANGFRTPVPDKPGALRILYLGDSVTWGGSTVDDEAIFSEVAADVLRNDGHPVYAMNAGVNATALLNHSERFLGYDGKLDALVWLFPWGDTKRQYAVVQLVWPSQQKPRLALVEVVDYLILKHWRQLSRIQPSSDDKAMSIESSSGDKKFRERVMERRKKRNLDSVREVVAEARSRGVPVVLGISPYRSGNKLLPLDPEAVAFIEEMKKQEGVTILDVASALENAEYDVNDMFIDVVHMTERGHRVVGEALGAKLQEILKDKQPAPDANSGSSEANEPPNGA